MDVGAIEPVEGAGPRRSLAWLQLIEIIRGCRRWLGLFRLAFIQMTR